MIGAVCLLVLAYLATVRQDRFLRFWAGAWALLLTRFIWNGVWGSPWPLPWLGTVAAFLRLAFAGCLLAGVEELRGRRVDSRPIFAVVLVYVLASASIEPLLPGRTAVVINLVLMLLIMLTASWRLGTCRQLPFAERSFTAMALAVYAPVTAFLPLLPEDSALLQPLFFVSWTLQLCIGVGMLAIFFRASHEAELRAEQLRGATLTEALRDFLPICMHCKSIRDDQEHWKSIEQYVADRSAVRFSHGLCPACARAHYDDLAR